MNRFLKASIGTIQEMKELQTITDFFFELSVLKKLPRSGSFIAGISRPDTVGEHVFRAAEIAFVLAEIHKADGEHAAFLTLIHDNGETRIGDHNRLMNRYFNAGDAEKRAFYDQIRNFPKHIERKFRNAFDEFKAQKTIESKCARDADLLELAFQSKEFLEQGFSGKKNWLDNINGHFHTKIAQEIFDEMQKKSSTDWWQGLKHVPKT